MPQDERTSRSPHWRRTGSDAYWPSSRSPSRATQISGPSAVVDGFSRYCQRQRRRLPSVSAVPKTSSYSRNSSSASDARRRSTTTEGLVLRTPDFTGGKRHGRHAMVAGRWASPAPRARPGPRFPGGGLLALGLAAERDAPLFLNLGAGDAPTRGAFEAAGSGTAWGGPARPSSLDRDGSRLEFPVWWRARPCAPDAAGALRARRRADAAPGRRALRSTGGISRPVASNFTRAPSGRSAVR
jgi:hypothetical protein